MLPDVVFDWVSYFSDNWATILQAHASFTLFLERLSTHPSFTEAIPYPDAIPAFLAARQPLPSSPGTDNTTMVVELHTTPSSALVDDDVSIYVTGLLSWQRVTITAVLVDESKTFVSSGQYVADENGRVDLNTAKSTGGTYIGVEAMGLLWSMKPAFGQRPGTRLMKRDVRQPFVIKLYALAGHRIVSSPTDVVDVLADSELHRYYMAPGVRDVKIAAGNIRGVLFIPAGDGPFPGVVDMFGGAGGVIKFRAALFASRGFATLALAYFGYEDLPPNLHLNLEYFDEAVDWLAAQPFVLPIGVGVVGVSKGAGLALSVSTSNPKVKAVVAINAYCVLSGHANYRSGHEQPCANINFDLPPDLSEEGGIVLREATTYKEELHHDALIHIESSHSTSFMFIVGEDDMSTDVNHVKVLVDLLKSRGQSNYTVLSYTGAGHLIEPPHAPHCRVAYTKILDFPLDYGGESRAHARAQEDSWYQIQAFLRRHLQPTTSDGSVVVQLHASKL